ncbi:MAG TPA: hypothetical protein VEN79_07965 [Terriglobia bacterium]|nr:hypothetical protein [Terriglobia bacterium]
MNNAFAAWMWSLGVVAHSYRTVMVLAALIAVWALAAYEWLGLPAESSGLMMILAFLWAIVQLLAAAAMVGGTLTGATEAAATEGRSFPLRALWRMGWKTVVTALVFGLASLMIVLLCSAVFDWLNAHSVEVASFLTFHSGRPVSHMRIEKIYNVLEGLWWMVFGGFLLSFFITLLRMGWRGAGKQTGKLLAGCAFRTPFLTNLLSVVVFGGIAYELANWHPRLPAGFWDYTQMVVRFSLILILISAGALFWSLSLAGMQIPKQESSLEGQGGPIL